MTTHSQNTPTSPGVNARAAVALPSVQRPAQPNSWPPGNAAPRFVDEMQNLRPWLIGACIMIAFGALGIALEMKINAAVLAAVEVSE